jgi:hypothetical protein
MIRFGSTGAIIPNARKSSVTVTIIKTNAARDAVRSGASGGMELLLEIAVKRSLHKAEKF